MNTVLAVAASMLTTAAQPGEGSVAVTLERLPAGGMQPRIAGSADGDTHIVFLRGDPRSCDVEYMRRDADGWSEPVRVGAPGAAVAMGAVRGPQIAADAQGRVHIAWNGAGQRTPPEGVKQSEPLHYTRSVDGGASFEEPRDMMGRTWALDGGASLAAGPDGRVVIAWHADFRDGGEGDAARALFFATSEDGGATFAAESRVEEAGTGCCACCSLQAFFDHKDRLNILYRAAAGNADRDMRILRAGAGQFWATPVDPWKVDACPLTTCAAAVAGGRTLIAWETQGQVWVGEVDAETGVIMRRAAPPGGDRHRKHSSIAVDAQGRVLLTWASATELGAEGKACWQVFDADLRPIKGQAGSADDLPGWSYPAAMVGASGFRLIY